MTKELEDNINEDIKKGDTLTNKLEVYEICKKRIRDHEKNKGLILSPTEYVNLIIRIVSKLKI